ncbi:hypothetical protein PG993_000585 [Apiospora rasikravindrae]|uniref:Hypervirulence associated protein TUDOR domain-containing protein n=1 Tax=Apiospora rasikravindrae TaxID=990691 RepID=A0ABR1U8Z3_9PEZI
MASSERPSPRVSIDESDSRPWVDSYDEKPSFSVGDKVYVRNGSTDEGPYVIATVGDGKFTLSLESGEAVRDGSEIDAGDLKAA